MNLEFEIIITNRAQKALHDIAKKDRLLIKQAVDKLIKYPHDIRVIKLTDRQGEYRLRAGNWRVLFKYNFQEGRIYILNVGHRRNIYR